MKRKYAWRAGLASGCLAMAFYVMSTMSPDGGNSWKFLVVGLLCSLTVSLVVAQARKDLAAFTTAFVKAVIEKAEEEQER